MYPHQPDNSAAQRRVLELRGILLEAWQDLQSYTDKDPTIKKITDRIGIALNQPEFSLLE
jgi:hypothetical protein